MKHKESDLQIRCVKWFRYQWPAFARLLEHPHNEGNGLNRKQQAIANAEGVTKGVADLILHVPSFGMECGDMVQGLYYSLAIEMKTQTGTQSAEQKEWQRLFQAAGGLYIIVRSYDDFVATVTKYMLNMPVNIKVRVKEASEAIQREADEKVRRKLRRVCEMERHK